MFLVGIRIKVYIFYNCLFYRMDGRGLNSIVDGMPNLSLDELVHISNSTCSAVQNWINIDVSIQSAVPGFHASTPSSFFSLSDMEKKNFSFLILLIHQFKRLVHCIKFNQYKLGRFHLQKYCAFHFRKYLLVLLLLHSPTANISCR